MTKVVSFNIESERELRAKAQQIRAKRTQLCTVSVSFKYGTIKFSTRYVEEKQLEGKYIKFHVDTARTKIMWTFLTDEAGFNSPDILKDYRQVKAYNFKTGKVYNFGLKQFLKTAFPIETEKGEVRRKLQVQECVVSHKNSRKFHYVEIS